MGRKAGGAAWLMLSAAQLAALDGVNEISVEALRDLTGTPAAPPAGTPSGPGRIWPLEHDEQAAFISRVREVQMRWPGRYPALDLIYAIPNGGFRAWITAVALTEEGVQRGVPDLCIPVARSGYHGAYLETKRQRGAPSEVQPEQVEWLARLAAEGYYTEVCYGGAALWQATMMYLEYWALLPFYEGSLAELDDPASDLCPAPESSAIIHPGGPGTWEPDSGAPGSRPPPLRSDPHGI